MLCPELTYQFQQLKDQAGGSILMVSRELSASATSASPTTGTYVVPADKILILSGASFLLTPGTGQIALRGVFQIASEGVSPQRELARFPNGNEGTVANAKVSFSYTCQHWIPPGDAISAAGLFDAGTNSNEIKCAFFGILIPRGNVQQG